MTVFPERFPKVSPYVLGSAANVKEVLGFCPLGWSHMGPGPSGKPAQALKLQWWMSRVPASFFLTTAPDFPVGFPHLSNEGSDLPSS